MRINDSLDYHTLPLTGRATLASSAPPSNEVTSKSSPSYASSPSTYVVDAPTAIQTKALPLEANGGQPVRAVNEARNLGMYTFYSTINEK